MRKIFALTTIAILAISMTLSLIPTSVARHEADIKWLDYRGRPYQRSSDTIYRPQWLDGSAVPTPSGWPWLNFTVANKGSSLDPIYKLMLIIPRNESGYAEYHFWRSIIYNSTETEYETQEWKATPDEIDNSGWPKVVFFETETNPIIPGDTFRFSLEFLGTRVPSCDRWFYIYTIDTGTVSTQPETRGNRLHLVTDRDPPLDPNMVHPLPTEGTSKDDPIIAIFDDYPDDWYMDLEFTVRDMSLGADHDTGVSRVVVDIEALFSDEHRSSVYPAKGDYFEPPVFSDLDSRFPGRRVKEMIWNLAAGYKPGTFEFRLTITIFDGARNIRIKTRNFWLKIPSYFYVTPAKGTVGRFDNTQNSLGEWSGSISDTYQGLLGYYQLGTEAHAIGAAPEKPNLIGFTPNSFVDVYVYHPILGKILVRKHFPTDNRGAFDAPFLFPKGPNGMYKVEAVDYSPDHITDYAWFEVLHGVIFMPDVVTGPAKVKVIASGLPVEPLVQPSDVIPRLNVDLFLIDGLDAILSVNNHVVENWYVDAWGVLHSTMTEDDERGLPQQGFFMPVLESGKYLLEFRTPGQRWDRTIYRAGRGEGYDYWKPSFTMQVATKFDEIKALIAVIGGKLDQLDLKIVNVNGTVVKFVMPKIEGTVNGRADQLVIKVDGVGTKVDGVGTKVDGVGTKVDGVGAKVALEATVKDLPGWTQEIHGWVKDINGDWATITTDVGDIKVDTAQLREDIKPGVSTLSTPTMLTMVLSAIAAIAAIVSVIVVVRRLKVAA